MMELGKKDPYQVSFWKVNRYVELLSKNPFAYNTETLEELHDFF